MRFFALVVMCAWAVTFAGCETTPSSGRTTSDTAPELDTAAATAAGLQTEDLVNAKALYVAKCARCHKFYDPAHYSDSEWQSWMSKMSRKARLQPEQEQLLSRYLQAYRTTRK